MFAISCVLQSSQFTIGSPNAVGMRFSDYFDFYPYSPTRDGQELLHDGHALRSLDLAEDFRGQPYPDLPPSGSLLLASSYDENLFKMLFKAWVERFERGRQTWRTNCLFRSLAIAYHACSLPKKNSLWFYDFGVGVALWVSAFEALAHPGRNGRSDLGTVLNLMSQAKFLDSTLNRRRKIKWGNNPRHGNAAGFLYWRLYESRNAFLHGNPVTVHDVLYKNRNQRALLTRVAPILFSVALSCHFDWFNKFSKVKLVGSSVHGLDLHMKQYLTRRNLEKPLKHILNGEDRRKI